MIERSAAEMQADDVMQIIEDSQNYWQSNTGMPLLDHLTELHRLRDEHLENWVSFQLRRIDPNGYRRFLAMTYTV